MEDMFLKYKQVLESEVESGKYGECLTLTAVDRVRRKAKQHADKYNCEVHAICIMPTEKIQHVTVKCESTGMIYKSPYVFGVQTLESNKEVTFRITVDNFFDKYKVTDFENIGVIYKFE